MNPYVRFGLMIATSTFVMYWLMYLNVFQITHIFFSEMRVYMALIMGSSMTIIMMLFMWKMYKNKLVNFAIIGVGILVFGVSLWLVRSQMIVDDTDYMEAMIPHHSIAILTSERAEIEDPRVKKLAAEISQTQKEEIALMESLIKDIEKHGKEGENNQDDSSDKDEDEDETNNNS
ncbi:DUF305 domain-containing protein [Allobacillus sp. GCM10007491]|uniref:DUF305 domain-containing protein n=1 Tax=Allobacillus saliphilus TaxID=2912308 RepID=A0A941CVE6_9BACI|nr:DUF305 domain-containing protein [Allobacillus saliphilus]MBR7553128.1 DUF305 domain-containing protein [Allobacillus saliphilus]